MELWHKPGQLSVDDSGDLHALLTPPPQSPAATDVWPVAGRSLVIIHAELSEKKDDQKEEQEEVICSQAKLVKPE